MFERNSEFFQLSRKVAEDFLQSAVIVDDRATFGESSNGEHAKKVETPPTRSLKPPDDAPEEQNTDVSRADAAHRFNAKEVIDSFARKGIVCSVLQIEEADRAEITETLHHLAICTDIIVIDWSLHKDNGEKALEMVKRIAGSSAEIPPQLRLIAIYTGEPNIMRISQRVKEILEEVADVKENDEGKVIEDDDGFALTFQSTRIVVFAKPETGVLSEYEHRRVEFIDVVDRLTEEFTVMTAGLVSNVVLKSLAEVRRNTHKVLSQFSSDLDAPYLTHRALLPIPDDAQDLLTSLISEELQAILEETSVGNSANLDTIKKWLVAREDKEAKFTLQLNNKVALDREGIEDLLQKGIEKIAIEKVEENLLSKTQSQKVVNNPHKLDITKTFCPDTDQLLDEKFAFVTTMRSYYGHLPQLTLGTILKDESSDSNPSYWVCIQPRCDCIRIETERVFPFLPLQADNTSGKFDVIVKEKDKYQRLFLIKKPHSLKLITFKPNANNETITSKKRNDTYYFSDAGNKEYQWMGEMRFEHAQRLSNDFARELSRVGVSESEWLRLWAAKG